MEKPEVTSDEKYGKQVAKVTLISIEILKYRGTNK